ncbi:MAG: dipeptide ABC transporter ATP-binding protein [Proteobacteria bacterium]|nr:dipeptide ABC transporter ATP-binding protein [Pseudomonadota bacterium]MBI3496980.1 dipeptide ABC transporter ATP-binding protein [Pseudomonadota bacterium]
MTQPSTLEVEGLRVSLPTLDGTQLVVRGVDLHVRRGETLCIVGESGCGKSMTSLALMNLLPRSAVREVDRLILQGEDLRGADEARIEALRGDRMAMIFQEPTTALNPAYTVGEQLIEGIRHHRKLIRRGDAVARAAELLGTCGIGQARLRLRQYPHQLSGGMRQRVMIAMALMTEPALLIADEPTTALDVTIQAQILGLLRQLQHRFDLAIILITHDFGVVSRFGDRVAVMYAGEIVETAPTETLLRQPMHPYTKALLSCMPGVRSGGSRLGYLQGQVPSLIGEVAGCQFRNRCPKAAEACARAIPQRMIAPDRYYRCVIPPAAATGSQALAEPAAAQAAKTGTSTAASAITLMDVAVIYRVRQGLFDPPKTLKALRGIALDLAPGLALGVVGESGSGKSTLARVMLGLERPRSGTVRLFGRDLGTFGRAALARTIQPVFQDPYSSLNPRRTVGATIRLPLDVHRIGTPAERDHAVERMMDLCGLPRRLASSYPAELSGGQRQRVAIASAVILRPPILICDEPTSALDVSVQSQILNLLQDLRAELGLTSVVISHDLNVIRYLADRIVVMYLGAIVEAGSARQVLQTPRHPYSQMLLATSAEAGLEAMQVSEPPSALALPSGCTYRTRCPLAMPICTEMAPPLRAVDGHDWACHLEPVGNDLDPGDRSGTMDIKQLE